MIQEDLNQSESLWTESEDDTRQRTVFASFGCGPESQIDNHISLCSEILLGCDNSIFGTLF